MRERRKVRESVSVIGMNGISKTKEEKENGGNRKKEMGRNRKKEIERKKKEIERKKWEEESSNVPETEATNYFLFDHHFQVN